MSGIFDSHAHYEDPAFDEDREAVLADLKPSGVELAVDVGASISSSHAAVQLAGHHDFLYASVGIHPAEILGVTEADWVWMEEEATSNGKIVAIGEMGLDYHWRPSKDEDLAVLYGTDEKMKGLQADSFAGQIRMAKRVHKPIIVHSRDAALDTYEILTREGADEVGGVIHCFSYSLEEALKYVEMGFYIGIGGVLTFKNAGKLKKVCAAVPMDRILLETDCPYMAPEPHRGERNDSRLLPNVVRVMAELKGLSTTEIVEITNANARKMYGIPE